MTEKGIIVVTTITKRHRTVTKLTLRNVLTKGKRLRKESTKVIVTTIVTDTKGVAIRVTMVIRVITGRKNKPGVTTSLVRPPKRLIVTVLRIMVLLLRIVTETR